MYCLFGNFGKWSRSFLFVLFCLNSVLSAFFICWTWHPLVVDQESSVDDLFFFRLQTDQTVISETGADRFLLYLFCVELGLVAFIERRRIVNGFSRNFYALQWCSTISQ